MPYRLWQVRLVCTNPACTRHPLAGGGLHRRVQKVLDIDRYYNLVTETLICTELISVQYLLRQNNEPLQEIFASSEETSRQLEELDVEGQGEEDEGFTEVIGQDGTVAGLVDCGELEHHGISPLLPPAPLQPPAPLYPPPPLQAPALHQAVDEHNIPGMDRVDALAEYLVELRHQTGLTLNNQQAYTIVSLWQNLGNFDKQRVMYAARHQERLFTGRFRMPKHRSDFTPGVESTKRCVLGSKGSPAQWPSCCRLIETIFVRLCDIYKSPRKQGKESLSRWFLILQAYRRIRQLLLGNGVVMEQTTRQPVEVNQTTLIQWHNKRLKAQEVAQLLKDVQLPEARPVAVEPLLPANIQPVVPVQHHQHQHQLHSYTMQPNTAGQARTRFRQPTATSVQPSAPHIQQGSSTGPRSICPRPIAAQRQLFPAAPPAPVPGIRLLCSVPDSNLTPSSVPSTTTATSEPTDDQCRAAPSKRQYNRSATSNTCKKVWPVSHFRNWPQPIEGQNILPKN